MEMLDVPSCTALPKSVQMTPPASHPLSLEHSAVALPGVTFFRFLND